MKKVLRRRYQHQVLLSRVTDTGKLRNIAHRAGLYRISCVCCPAMTPSFRWAVRFFVDLYGVPQFEHALCTFMAKKPLFMIGHSVGPFRNLSSTSWQTMCLATAMP